MTKRLAPWAFITIASHIDSRLSLGPQQEFGKRMMKLYDRITGIIGDTAIPDWQTFVDGKNPLDAIACWFLLLLLHDRDWGVRQRTKDPQDIAAIDSATTLLRRWLEGDATESEEWTRLLPDPIDANARGTLSSAGYVGAGMGRVFLNLDLAKVLDAAANAYFGVPLSKRLVKPFPVTIGSRIFQLTLVSLGIIFFPLALWGLYRNRIPIPIHRGYYNVLARALVRLCELRWNPQDPDEARLFPLVVGGSRPELLADYLACLRRQHVEPDEIADAQEILTRMSDAARSIGLQFADPRFVTGMPPRRLFPLDGPPPAVVAAYRDLRFPMHLTGSRLEMEGEVTVTTPAGALKTMETKSDELRSWGNLEFLDSLSRRVFFRTKPGLEYWVIEMNWDGDNLPKQETDSPSVEPASGSQAQWIRLFRIVLRQGPWPVEGDLWDPPATQHRRWMEFPTRSAALAWYRREVDRQIEAGFTESMPRLAYFSMKTRPVPIVEGKVIFDSKLPVDTPDELWIQQQSRLAFRPVVQVGDGPADVSKLSGVILSPKGTGWPVCPTCKQSMSLLLQLNLDQLPQEVQHRFGAGLLQFFICANESDCSGKRGPFTETQFGRIVDPHQPNDSLEPPTPQPARIVISWQPETDYLARDDFYEHGFGELNLPYLGGEDRDQTLVQKFPCRPGDKLAGWPLFRDGTDYCPECSQQMQIVFQMDSSGLIPFTMWENSQGILMQCPKHHHILALITRSS